MIDKNAVNQILIRRLRAAGCPMPGDCEDDPIPGISIVVSRPEITKAYVLRRCIEYVFAVRISNDSYVPLELQKFECQLPSNTRLIWLTDPRIHTPEKQTYRLPESGKEFPCKMVINYLTGRSGIIRPGDSVEGVLLALRMGRVVPEDYLAGPVIPAEVSLVDQQGRKHSSPIEVNIDRTAIITSLKRIRRHEWGPHGAAESQASIVARELEQPSMAAEMSDISDRRSNPESPIYQEIPNNFA